MLSSIQKLNIIECKCLCFNKNYQKMFDKNLKKQFFNTCKFSNDNINKFTLLLWKFFYLFEIFLQSPKHEG